jgi:hypothetical protein
MPMLLLVFALAIDLGSLQLERLRLHYALDLASVAAATSVDQPFYASTGRLRLDPTSADAVARQSLSINLVGLPDTPDPASLVREAEIVVVNQVPGRDPFTGSQLDRPAICARIRTTHRFSLLGLVGMRSTEIRLTASAEIRP